MQITLDDIDTIARYIGTPRFIDIETLTKRYLFTSHKKYVVKAITDAGLKVKGE
ncbi:hypothetical protein [Cronobacter sakazakii]|uniref:hypothetical protein n=1 Tax=Cronobacter sakazakii TaxID=28141 RepID=UPI0013FD7B53|nr:hypothetical protein [Cronobacter sakazakii]